MMKCIPIFVKLHKGQFYFLYANNRVISKYQYGKKENKIGIIGLGATGVAYYYHLIKQLGKLEYKNKEIEINIFELKKQQKYRGLAYGIKKESFILNMRAEEMHLDKTRPHDFLEYLESIGNPYKKQPYVSRAIFGDYLEKNFNESLKESKKIKVKTKIINDEVTDLLIEGDQVCIITKNSRHSVDFLNLSVGNIFSDPYPELQKNEKYISSPYHIQKMGLIPKKASVAVLGSSLTAVDAAVLLYDKGYEGKIYFASRGGNLPGGQVEAKTHEYKYLTLEKIEALTENHKKKIAITEIFRLFKKELEEATGQKINLINIRTDHIKNSYKNNPQVQSVLNGTAEIIPHLWNSIEPKDQIHFMNEFYSLWCSYRHCMPKINADKILEMINSGRLTILKGVKKVYEDESKHFIVEAENKIKTEYLINAIGADYSIKNSPSKLLKKMYLKGVVSENPCGGLNVDFKTHQIIDKKGEKIENIYFVGALTRGVHFFTNAMSMNSAFAFDVANQISHKIYES